MRKRFKVWARPESGLGKGSGTLQETAPSLFPGPPSSRTGQKPVVGPGEKTRIPLLPHSPPEDHRWGNHRLLAEGTLKVLPLRLLAWSERPTVAANQWLSRPTNGHPLTVAHLGEGPTVAANQWGATIKGLRVTSPGNRFGGLMACNYGHISGLPMVRHAVLQNLQYRLLEVAIHSCF